MMSSMSSLLKRRKIQSIGLGLCLLFYCRSFLFQIQYLVPISTTHHSFRKDTEGEKDYPTTATITTTTTTTTNSRRSPHYYYHNNNLSDNTDNNDHDDTSGVINVTIGNNNNNNNQNNHDDNIGLLGSSYFRRVIRHYGYDDDYDSFLPFLIAKNKYNSSDNIHQHQHHHHHVVQFPQTSLIIPPPSDDTSSSTTNGISSSETKTEKETKKESWYERHCHPIIEVKFRPTCNSIHELEFFDTTTTTTTTTTSSSTTTTVDKKYSNNEEEIMNNSNNNNVISLLSTAGSWRSVWKYNEIINYPSSSSNNNNNNNNNITLSIKVLKLSNPRHPNNNDYDIRSYTQHNLDSFVYERLSQSSYVVSSFGYCGQSIITEYANAFFETFNKQYLQTFFDRIVVAQQLAHGLYELHTLQPILSSPTTPYPNITASSSSRNSTAIQQQQQQQQSPLLFAHHDINPANLVSINPTATKSIQWNDFNLGIITRKYYDDDDDFDNHKDQNITTDNIVNNGTGMCGVRAIYMKEKWRSPEIIRNYKSKNWIMNIHASDIYEFGNVLFCLLTKESYPWRWNLMDSNNTSIRPSASQIGIWKSNGTLPKLPYQFWDQFDDNDDYAYDKLHAMVLWEATKACYRYNPDERPTAWKLATAIHTAHDWFLQLQQQKQQQGDERRQQDSAATIRSNTTTQRKRIQPPSIKDIQELFN